MITIAQQRLSSIWTIDIQQFTNTHALHTLFLLESGCELVLANYYLSTLPLPSTNIIKCQLKKYQTTHGSIQVLIASGREKKFVSGCFNPVVDFDPLSLMTRDAREGRLEPSRKNNLCSSIGQSKKFPPVPNLKTLESSRSHERPSQTQSCIGVDGS